MYFSEAKSLNPKNSFTLVELLIVIAIIAILGAATIFVINPTEILKKTRDTVRISDLKNLDLALQMAELEGLDLGNPNVVYISLPDSNSNCSSYSLPSLPSGWSYHCASEADYRKVDGNGWIPVNFTALSSGAPFSSLPVDPINDENHYYMYFVGGSYELNTWFESQKYAKQMSQDGGDNPCLYEKGSNLSLGVEPGLVAYWKMDEDSWNGTYGEVKDSSGNDNHGTAFNGANTTSDAKLGRAGSFDGSDDYIAIDNLHYSNPNEIKKLTVTAWVKVPSSGGNWSIVDFDRSEYYSCPAGVPNTSPWGEGDYVGFHTTASGYGIKDMWSNTPIRDGNWHFVAWVFDSDEVYDKKIYIDGNLDAKQDAYPTGVGLGSGKTRYGFIGDGSEAGSYNGGRNGMYYEGLADEIRIYHRALSASEIKLHYLAEKEGR